jgi:type IV pilus assembly protein PilQ
MVAMPVEARSSAEVALKLKRQGADIQVVVVGLGSNARVVTQTSSGATWRGRLIGDVDAVLSQGPQQVSMLGAGLASIRLDASNGGFELQIEATPGRSLPKPSISSNGKDLVFNFGGLPTASQQSRSQTTRLDLRRPGRVQQSAYVPPLRARAVAPPVGDMAVGSMLISNRSYVNVSGPQVSLNLSNAPAKDALMSLARLGDYGFVFVGGANVDSDSQISQSGAGRNVTMSFREERFDRALNSVLMASGLQAKLDGRTLLVGESVSGKTFGPQMSKVYRLNQASAGSAADYLASLGAQINKVSVVSTANNGGNNMDNGAGVRADTQAAATFTDVETYGASTGPLRGLTGTTDSRLQTVTLVGDSQLIAVAEGYLKQIDLRQRQVAVKVQILNIDLLNDKSIDSSFSARLGDTFIVSESGRAFMNFGAYRPGNRQGTGLLANGTEYATPAEYSAGLSQVQQQKVFDPPLVAKQREVVTQSSNSGGTTSTTTLVPVLIDGQEVFVPSTDPSAEASLTPRFDKKGRPIYVPAKDPNKFSYPKNSFYSYVEAVIESSSAKTLAQPTLLVQEGQEAEVQTGTSVITSVSTTDTSNGSTQFEYSRENAGLSLNVAVSKIDDNGYVSLNIDPKISVPEPAGESNGVAIFNIVGRSLSSGSIRLRDRQTLILTGVIQDQDKEIARKWPILGDLPLIGQLFRSTDSQRSKNELVILVTPMIVDDEMGGSYGYGYRPSSREARQLMGSS